MIPDDNFDDSEFKIELRLDDKVMVPFHPLSPAEVAAVVHGHGLAVQCFEPAALHWDDSDRQVRDGTLLVSVRALAAIWHCLVVQPTTDITRPLRRRIEDAVGQARRWELNEPIDDLVSQHLARLHLNGRFDGHPGELEAIIATDRILDRARSQAPGDPQ